MKKLFKNTNQKLALGLFLSISSVSAMEDASTRYDEMLEKAGRLSPLAAKAIQEEKAFREAVSTQITTLRDQIAEAQENPNVEDPEQWSKKVLEQVESDIAITTALNATLGELHGQKVPISYPVRFNKIADILAGVDQLLRASFSDLLEGTLPQGYAYGQKTVTILGGENESTIWGNSRGTFLKTALMYIFANREEGAKGTFRSFGFPWFENSALAHITMLPQQLNLDLTSYSFAYSFEGEGQLGLITPHSGYAFGGHRCDAKLYLNGKRFGPQDCSSFVGSLTNSPTYTTADQLCAFRKKTSTIGLVPEGWEKGPDARYLLENTSAVIVEDPSAIQPGQVYCHRRFPASDPSMEGLGSGGHTAIVMGILDGDVVTMGANRDMPKLEGFGLQNFPWKEEPLKQKMFFEVKL